MKVTLEGYPTLRQRLDVDSVMYVEPVMQPRASGYRNDRVGFR